jgi:hypothetical protein
LESDLEATSKNFCADSNKSWKADHRPSLKDNLQLKKRGLVANVPRDPGRRSYAEVRTKSIEQS